MGALKIHIIKADDWVRLYINGKLAEEGHSIRLEELCGLLVGANNVTSDYVEEKDGDYYDYCDAWEAAHRDTGEPMISEVKIDQSLVSTDQEWYEIQPGGLYLLILPPSTTDADEQHIKSVIFAPGTTVLDPPATFLICRSDVRLKTPTAEYLDGQVEQAERRLQIARDAQARQRALADAARA